MPAYVASIYSWSGLYFGGQVGYAQDSIRTTMSTPAGVALANWSGAGGGIVGGLYSGYNWRIGGFVFGVDSDVEGSSLNKSLGPVIGLYDATAINWQASLRARLGFAVDRALFYVAGGLADASLKQSLFDAGNSTPFNANRLGYTVGGGVDYAVTDNLVGRID
jgi:outer membrane immunogenic protein